ncbi:MAG: S41 family peptidase [Planctomycetaceae bacterium]|nr:S41 family peptidase [Planctomycetaceae bacterium]
MRWVVARWLAVGAISLSLSAAPAVIEAQVRLSAPVAESNIAEPARLAQPEGIAPLTSTAEIRTIIERGRVLETERRWGEALTVYEDALRNFPRDPDLTQRFNVARIHYDLARRYSDVSFRDAIAQLPASQALEQLGEVLLKVQSHYVDTPNWAQFVNSGTAAFDRALIDAVFVERHLSQTPSAKINDFRRVLHDALDTYGGSTRVDSRQRAIDAVATAARMAREHLALPETVTILEYVSGIASSLDPYSTYLTPAQLNEVYSQIEGNFVGLGVELKASNGSLLIVKVIPNSPADRAGIRANDRIVAVDGHNTSDLSTDQAANMLQGKEGTMVDVTVVSPGFQPRALRVRREQVEVPSVDQVKVIDPANGIGYLRITCFQKTTSRDMDAALWKLNREGMRSLIIDLRGNPGGLLTSSVDLVDKFVDTGIIVSTRGRSPQEDYNYQAHQAGTWRVPLVVLIDGDSASASEIFAGAIRDHRRGTIVGSRSYGKGSVQGIFPLAVGNAGLRLTTAKFYSPNGHPYSQVGVSPDVAVQEVAKPVTNNNHTGEILNQVADSALEAAKNVARRTVARR